LLFFIEYQESYLASSGIVGGSTEFDK